jgi:hypothetical protein
MKISSVIQNYSITWNPKQDFIMYLAVGLITDVSGMYPRAIKDYISVRFHIGQITTEIRTPSDRVDSRKGPILGEGLGVRLTNPCRNCSVFRNFCKSLEIGQTLCNDVTRDVWRTGRLEMMELTQRTLSNGRPWYRQRWTSDLQAIAAIYYVTS